MNRLLTLLLLAAAITHALAQQPVANREMDVNAPTDPIVTQELSLWRAYGKQDFAAVAALLLPDYLTVAEAIRTRAEVLALMPTCTLDRFEITAPRVRNLTPDSAVVVYRFSYSLTCNKVEAHVDANATTVWVRRNDRWLVQLHTETPVVAQK